MKVVLKSGVCAGVVSVLLGLGTGSAFAWADSGYQNWTTFSSSGVSLCAQNRAYANPTSGYGDYKARGQERTLKSGCSTGQTRPANRMGISMSFWFRHKGDSTWSLMDSSGGYNYNSEAAQVKQSSFNFATGPLNCTDVDYMTTVYSREWDDDVSSYITSIGARAATSSTC